MMSTAGSDIPKGIASKFIGCVTVLLPRIFRGTILARMGIYAQCTYIDHQIRLLIGTLREEGVLDNTIVMLVSDHGDMLGNHNPVGETTDV